MDSLIHLDIAGLCTTLDIADHAMRAQVRERYMPFVVRDAPSAMHVTVHVVSDARFVTPRKGPWVIETAQVEERLTYRSYYDAGWMDFARGEAQLQIAPEATLENFLRVLYAHLVLHAGGLLLHAAGVVRNDDAFVFFGPSGSGKSTSARLSFDAGYTVLSDDLVIVRRCADRYRVYGVPFRGTEHVAPLTRADAELAGLFALRQSNAHVVMPLSSAEAVTQLVRVVPFVMSVPSASAQVIAQCTDVAQRVCVGALYFRKDVEFWRKIDEYVALVPSAA